MSVTDFSKRNREMYDLRQTGMTYTSIAKKYGLTTERVRQIVLHEQRSADQLKFLEKRKEDISSGKVRPSFIDILTYTRVHCGYNTGVEIRTFNCLWRSGIINEIDNKHRDPNSYSDADLLKIRNFGIASLNFYRKACEIWDSKVACID